MTIEAINAFNEWNKDNYMGTTEVVKAAFIKGFMYAMDPDRPTFPKDELVPLKYHECAGCTFYACEKGCTDK